MKRIGFLYAFLTVVLTCPLAWGAFTMDRPNTLIYQMQCTGSGNKDTGTTVTFRLIRKDNASLIAEGNYSDSYSGWMKSLTYSPTGLGVAVSAELWSNGQMQKQKDVVTATQEN